MKLSEVPFPQLVTTEGWLTSANNKKGKIVHIDVRPSGKFFETSLSIEWEDGTTSQPVFPDECDKVTVNDPVPSQCGPYIDNQKRLMEAGIRYLEACRLNTFKRSA
ncbi:hypothetical protein [Pseudomonas phage D6]|nr:hypothetical protein [Pseudomonas phage D6]